MSYKVLYISGSFGLGHVNRDLAIAHEMRRICPEVKIYWLAGSPACEVLGAAGEVFAPEQSAYRGETELADSTSHNGELSLTAYVFRAMLSWMHNAHVSAVAASRGGYNVIVGDETYEILIANLFGFYRLPPIPFIVLYDFLGMDVVSNNVFEKLGAWIINLLWTNAWRVTTRRRNAAVFIGEREDVADRSFGWLLSNRRQIADKTIEFVGYAFPFNKKDIPPRDVLRRELGYGKEPLVICTVGGTSVGRDLLELCGQAFPLVTARVHDVHLVLVAGPRIDPISLDVPKGIDCRGMVPSLWKHLAVCDLAVLQGGGMSTLEAEVLRVPFLFFPVENQAEQQVTVANRLTRHKAGVRMSIADTSPQQLADAIVANLGVKVTYPEIPADGTLLAARRILERAEIIDTNN
jgi:UDP:flavonoid glycosyltransferase YjiC (YdhE family)